MTKKAEAGDIPAAAKEGAYLSGFVLQGARWDLHGGSLQPLGPNRSTSSPMPVLMVRGVVTAPAAAAKGDKEVRSG